MSRRKIAELETPFSVIEWPIISQQDQDTILELLCTLLEPLGQYRRNHVTPSSGKRRRRRSKQVEAKKAEGSPVVLEGSGQASKTAPPATQRPIEASQILDSVPPPPPPELAAFVDVGLSSISRGLVTMHAPSSTPSQKPSLAPYAAVFVVRSGHPSAFYSHFPQMVAMASQVMRPPSPSTALVCAPIRLVGFSRASEERLASCFGIPRVSSIALREGAPGSQGLIDFLGEKVLPVDAHWLKEAQAGRFLETQIHIASVPVGQKRKKT